MQCEEDYHRNSWMKDHIAQTLEAQPCNWSVWIEIRGRRFVSSESFAAKSVAWLWPGRRAARKWEFGWALELRYILRQMCWIKPSRGGGGKGKSYGAAMPQQTLGRHFTFGTTTMIHCTFVSRAALQCFLSENTNDRHQQRHTREDESWVLHICPNEPKQITSKSTQYWEIICH